MTEDAAAADSFHNADPAELERYASRADLWWSPTGPFWPLHRLNELRIVYIKDTLCARYGRKVQSRRPLEGLRVLDVGCGGGILSESMARLGANVHGIDVVERNILIASHHASVSDLPIRYELTSVDALENQGVPYDVVC